MPGHAVQWLDEHTGTTDDTHLLGTDGVPKRGFLMGIMVTTVGAAGGTITLYDTSIATGAGAYAAEAVLFGPIVVQAPDRPFLIDLSHLRKHFINGIGIDLDAVDLGAQVGWAS